MRFLAASFNQEEWSYDNRHFRSVSFSLLSIPIDIIEMCGSLW